ncbi:MAG: hypothetical protein PUP46_05095 [Endozoicomonas sp. (ex Botrylloides leachii)]|nr:hypothetical protein [Endozoicomonas sp. (ex Botrylloides leachii)]
MFKHVDDEYSTMLDTAFYSQRLTKTNYQAEGFDSFDEALSWTDRICGLACLKMVIAQLTQQVVPLKRLLDQGLAMNGYKKGVGWIHQKLADMVMAYGVSAQCQSIGDHLYLIDNALEQRKLVIASVSCGFNPDKKGGHLVLIIGRNKESYIIHHPSAKENEQWSHHTLSTTAFQQCFSVEGNIIIISGST